MGETHARGRSPMLESRHAGTREHEVAAEETGKKGQRIGNDRCRIVQPETRHAIAPNRYESLS